jgi:hypothetical protein
METNISKNTKEYKQAGWFVNRLIELGNLSHKEIVDICEMAATLAKQLDVTTTETIHSLEQTW